MTQAQPTPRMIVPDVARGLALLGIALANVATAWAPTPTAPAAYFGGVMDGSILDQIVVMITAVTAHSRGLPMFSTLLGFGVGLIVMSLWRKQFPLPRTRAIVLRRYFFLALFGLAHGLLLFFGDIMFFYGVCGLLLAVMLTLSDKAITIVAWCLLGITLVVGTAFSVAMYFAPPGLAQMSADVTLADNYLGTLGSNAMMFGIQTVSIPMFLFMYLPVMMIGFVWARKGVLADVPAHRPLLVRWTAVAVVISLGVGIPWGLAAIGVLPAQWELVMMNLNLTLGVLTGPGILAGLALLLQGVQERVNGGAKLPVALAIPVALGKRSMSGYLIQSVLFFIIVQPYLVGFGEDVGAAALAAMACAIWLVTLGLAWVWEALGWQGPFEWAHRRLSYGASGRPQLTSAKAGGAG